MPCIEQYGLGSSGRQRGCCNCKAFSIDSDTDDEEAEKVARNIRRRASKKNGIVNQQPQVSSLPIAGNAEDNAAGATMGSASHDAPVVKTTQDGATGGVGQEGINEGKDTAVADPPRLA